MKTKMYDVFFEIIDRHLSNRENLSDKDILSGVWLQVMLEELQNNIPNSTLEELKVMDRYNLGQRDYHSKFALHCDELYQKNTQ